MSKFSLLLIILLTVTPMTNSYSQDFLHKKVEVSEMEILYGQLKKEIDVTKAKRIVAKIRILWEKTGDKTSDAIFAWIRMLFQRQDFVGALVLLEKNSIKVPEHAETWNLIAVVRYVQKDYVGSLIALEKALAYNPDHFNAMIGMANVFEAMGDYERSVFAANKALEYYPASKPMQDLLIRINLELEKTEV